MILLRPYILGYKNRLSGNVVRSGWWRAIFHFDILVLLSIALVMLGIYGGSFQILEAMRIRDGIDGGMIVRATSIVLFGFFFLLLFSSFLASLGTFFVAHDLPLILITPISRPQFYLAKFVETLCSAGWMYFIFMLPLLFGVARGYQLPLSFVAEAFFIVSLFSIIPTAIGIAIAILFVNFFPISKLGDIVIFLSLAVIGVFFISSDSENISRYFTASEAVNTLSYAYSPVLPSTWAGFLIARTIPGMSSNAQLYAPFLCLSALVFIASYAIFESFYMRGYASASETKVRQRVRSLSLKLPMISLGKPKPMLAMFVKEFRLFLRDATQALQLALILLLTFLYLYNFRTLQTLADLSPEAQRWWESLLNIANIFMGASVSSAIATRFVFPALSLEGRAYHLLRTTPLSIGEFVRAKFFAWLIPISLLTLVLLLSGAFAIQASFQALAVTIVVSFSLAVGIVGLGIGSGAMYARFDWDSPTQVVSHFGSLVYMLLSLGIILVTLIPAGYTFVAIAVPHIFASTQTGAYYFSIFCALFLVVFVNCIAASSALHAAEISLTELERN